MILRKPYAFLIKNFRIIHIVLTFLMIYVVYKYNNIAKFIQNYIDNIANTQVATSYVGLLMFLAVILIIGINITLYILMRYKKKPKLLYLFTSIAYFIIFVGLFIVLYNFKNMEIDILDPKTIRLLRDIVNIILYPQYIFILAMIVRALGFDIKKFNFASDIDEMNIDITDDEEVELTIGVDPEVLKTKGRRRLREFKYYVLENKVFVFTILGVIGFITIISIILNVRIFYKVYKENDNVPISTFNINVLDSYITTKNDNGEDIGYNDTSYVIVKFKTKLLYDLDYDTTLDLNKILLNTGGEKYVPITKYYDSFKAIGIGYKNQLLTYDNEKTYILVYSIPNSVIKKSKTIQYEGGFEQDGKIFVPKVIKIRIKPTNIDEVNYKEEKLVGEITSFDDSSIKGNIKVSEYDLKDKFIYEYNYCIKEECVLKSSDIIGGYKKLILKLNIENNLENIDTYTLGENFIKVKYTINGQEYTSSLKNKTPTSSKSTLYLEVEEKIKEANNIYVEINIRDKIVKYVLK